jgi:hypothetical protein
MSPQIPKSDQMQRALEASGGGPVYVTDAEGRVTHVLIPAEVYQRLQGIIGDQVFDVRETYEAQEKSLASIWDEPGLDIYNDYDLHRGS